MTTKVIHFHRGEVERRRDRWGPVLAGDRAPLRVSFAVPLVADGLPSPAFDAVEVVWLAGGVEQLALDEPLRSFDPALAPGEGSVAIVVEEVVGRGADALTARWADGGPRPKMMSFGRRARTLSREDFADRWRAEAGSLGGEPMPDEVRGIAYVQDHPVGDDPPFDAINEVWFDDAAALGSRARWLAARPIPAGLMDPPTCATLCLVEELLSA